MAFLDKLISFYEFDEASGQAQDSHGGNHSTSLSVTYGAAGKVGNAFEFNGSSDHVTIPHVAELMPLTRIAVGCWFTVPAAPPTSGISNLIHKGYLSAENAEGYTFRINWKSAPNNVELQFSTYGSNGEPKVNVFSGNTNMVAGGTYCLVAVKDETTYKIYIDNVLKATTTNSTDLHNSTQQLTIGAAFINALQWYCPGIIDQPFVADALTVDEVGEYWNNGNGISYQDIAPSAPSFTLTCEKGSYSLSGKDANISHSSVQNFTVSCDTGHYRLSTGYPTGLKRIWIDADTGNEVDDPYAIVQCLIEPTFLIEGLSSCHYNLGGASDTDYSQTLNESILTQMGMSNISHPRGSDDKMVDKTTYRQSDAVDEIIARAHAGDTNNKLTILVLGAFTNVASAIVKDPTIESKITLVLMGFRYSGEILTANDFNANNDLDAVDALMDSSVEIRIMPGQPISDQLLFTKAFAATKLVGKDGIWDWLYTFWDTHPTYGTVDPKRMWDICGVSAVIDPSLVTFDSNKTFGARSDLTVYDDVLEVQMQDAYWASVLDAQDNGTRAFNLSDTTHEVNIIHNRSVICEKGSYLLDGKDVNIAPDFIVSCEKGSYNSSGNNVDFIYSLANNFTLTCETGHYLLDGKDAIIAENYRVVCQSGNYSLTGQDLEIIPSFAISCDKGSYNLSGKIVGLNLIAPQTFTIECEKGHYRARGRGVNFHSFDPNGFENQDIGISVNNYKTRGRIGTNL